MTAGIEGDASALEKSKVLKEDGDSSFTELKRKGAQKTKNEKGGQAEIANNNLRRKR